MRIIKSLLVVIALFFFTQSNGQANFTKITGFFGVLHPLVTVSSQETTVNFRDSYTVGFPFGANFWKTNKTAFSIEIIPYIKAEIMFYSIRVWSLIWVMDLRSQPVPHLKQQADMDLRLYLQKPSIRQKVIATIYHLDCLPGLEMIKLRVLVLPFKLVQLFKLADPWKLFAR